MPLISILLIALGLAMDAFAVSIACGVGIRKLRKRHALLIGAAFGLFQGIMPLVGWWLGKWAAPVLSVMDYWLAGGLLVCIGAHMMIEAQEMEEAEEKCPLNPKVLLALAVATSIDAFAVGLSLSLMDTDIFLPAVIIAAVTFAMSIAGCHIGEFFGHIFE